MKFQSIVMTCAFALATVCAFAFKGNGNRLPLIYGKITGAPCTALCTTTASSVCSKVSDDGIFYTAGNCATVYTGPRYEIQPH